MPSSNRDAPAYTITEVEILDPDGFESYAAGSWPNGEGECALPVAPAPEGSGQPTFRP
jgi:hypothetical protein